jgi:CDGSH-type Zn-finger protein/uncharacterized Fe-S cluster protein YjdI
MTGKAQTFTGKQVSITVHPGRCIHSRNCVLGHPEVWVANAPGQWVHPDAGDADTIATVAQSCPSGAITYQRHDGGPDERPPAVNTVRIWENGPYAFRADLSLAGDRTSYRATLCRCGASRRKPYCDGSHRDAGFVASGEPAAVAASGPPPALRNGPVEVTPLPNGPLQVVGPVEVCAGSGHPVVRGDKLFLCRCGGSATKPLCDGTHRRNGFQAP